MDSSLSVFGLQLQRCVTLSTQEASEYERAQRLNLLQPALDAVKQGDNIQLHISASQTPQLARASVLLRPLAAAQPEEPEAGKPVFSEVAVEATPAAQLTDLGTLNTKQALQQPTPATSSVLPTPMLMTPAAATAALMQTPASSQWASYRPGDTSAASLGLSPAMALSNIRPLPGFPGFLPGMMSTPVLQQRPMRPGEQQQAEAEADGSKTSKKRQGYHIEPAALQKLIEKQQLEAQRKGSQGDQATATDRSRSQDHIDSRDEPPPRQQHHRPRVLSRLPPQVKQQAERQAQERAQQQQQQQLLEATAGGSADLHQQQQQHMMLMLDPAAAAAAPVAMLPAGLSLMQAMAAGDVLESPDASMGFRLADGLDQGQGLDLSSLDDSSKLFGNAQKRLRLSMCDKHGVLLPAAQPLISPVPLPTPSPAAAPGVSMALSAAAAAAAAAAVGDGVQQQQAAGASTTFADAPTPSKFFSGSPVPQTERKQMQRAPETPVMLGQPPRIQEGQEGGADLMMEPLRGGAHAAATVGAATVGAAAGSAAGAPGPGNASSWVPIPAQTAAADLLAAATDPAVAAAAAAGMLQKEQLAALDPAAAAALPVAESPIRRLKQQREGGGGGAGGGGVVAGLDLSTPEGAQQQPQVQQTTPGTADAS